MQTAIDVEIGQVLRRIRFTFTERKRRIVSQGEFGAMVAKAMNREAFPQSTVSEWESGNNPAPAGVLITALRLLSELVGHRVSYPELTPNGSENLTGPYLPLAA